ncbi:MAG: hypothetical protein ABI579_00035 [Candidatus Sumerlaeota bacterium]
MRVVVFVLGFLLSMAAYPALAQQELSFKKVGELPTYRQMHGSVVLGDYLYVIGGELGGLGKTDIWTDSVLKAPLLPDGSIGQWTPTVSLPQKRGYIGNSTIALNDIVYVVGGSAGDNIFNTAVYAKPLPDGNLGPWIQTPPFSTVGLAYFPVVATPGYIHVLGGADKDSRVSAATMSGKIGPTGEILSWEAGPKMPSPLWFHSAATLGGKVWTWGGLPSRNSKETSNRIFSAAILSDGRLAPWREEPTKLPVSYYMGVSSSAGPYLMTFCPKQLIGGNTEASSDVYFTSITPGLGGLKQWTNVPSNLPVKLYLAIASDYRRGRVYIPGGRTKGGDSTNAADLFDKGVFMFTLSPKARAEYKDEAETAETVRTGSYTYQKSDILPATAVPGFLSLSAARRFSSTENPRKPLVLYFHKEGVKTCDQQVEILKDPAFADVSKLAGFAWMDTETWPQLRSQLGVYRVPTWIVYNANTQELGRANQVVTIDQLKQFLGQVK